MIIEIDYYGAWRNSFLDGDNNSPIPKGGRRFIASGKGLTKEENFKRQETSKDTIMGIMNRLIGDRKKLYQARAYKDYFFRDLEDKISFVDNVEVSTMSLTRILNLKASDPTLVTGGLQSRPLFQAEFSQRLFNIFKYSSDEILKLLLVGEESLVEDIELEPFSFSNFIELEIKKSKKIEADKDWIEAIEKLLARLDGLYSTTVEKKDFIDSNNKVNMYAVYCASLYFLQEQIKTEMEESEEYLSAFPKSGLIPGFARKGFTKKAFISYFSSGKIKLLYGGPYKANYWTQIEGKEKMTKVEELLKIEDGKISIYIDIEKSSGKKLKKIIEEADVTVFPFGKKGLAHVSKIKV